MPPNYPGSTSTTYDSNSQLTSTTTDSEMLHMLDFEFDSSGNGGNTAKCHTSTGNSYTVSTTLGNLMIMISVLPAFTKILYIVGNTDCGVSQKEKFSEKKKKCCYKLAPNFVKT